MKCEPIRYMEWVKTQPRAGVDLRLSGVDRYPLKKLDFPFTERELTGPNFYGYIPFLEKTAERYRAGADQVISCLGTSQALFMVCAALVNPGDEVVVEKPAYEPLLSVPRSLGARIVRLDRPFASGYAWDEEGFKKAIGPKTRLVVLTNLHNPSGVYQAPERIRRIAGWAAEKGAWLLVDEVYLDFMEGDKAESAFMLANNIFVVSSLTKVYGLGGIRAGWIISPAEWVPALRRIADHIHVEHVYLSEQIALHALDRLDEIRAITRPRIEKNGALVKSFIQGEEKLSWAEPDGGIVCFPKLEGAEEAGRFCRSLLEQYDTAVVPGLFFESPRHFRLAFGARTDILEKGLDNIARALRDLS
jgi:aspartate/methionine/tyrosine aminotransferase